MGLTISMGAAHCTQLSIDYREVVGFATIRTVFEQHHPACCDDDL